MNTKKFLQAMNNIDEKYIKEADIFAPEPLVESTGGRIWYRVVGAVACAVLVCGIAVFGGKGLMQVSECTNAGAAVHEAQDAAYIDGGVAGNADTDSSGSEKIDTATQPDLSDIHALCCTVQMTAEDFWAEKFSADKIHLDLNEAFATHKSPIEAGEAEAYEYDGIIFRTRNTPDLAAVDGEAAEEAVEEYFLKLERDGNSWAVTDIQTTLAAVAIPDGWDTVEWVINRNDDGTVTVCDTYDMENGFVRYITRTTGDDFGLKVIYDESNEIFDNLLSVAADSAQAYLGNLNESNTDLDEIYLDRVEITELNKDAYDRIIAAFHFDVKLKNGEKYVGDKNDEVTYTKDKWNRIVRTVKIYQEDGEWKCVGVNDAVDVGTDYYTTHLVKYISVYFTPEISGTTDYDAAEIPMPDDDFQG